MSNAPAPRDINSVVLTGTVESPPYLHTLKNSQKLLAFTLKVVERYQLKDGTPAQHENFFAIEILGRHVETHFRDIEPGKRYMVTGYLRADDLGGVEKIRIRCFNLQTA
jgi:single-stranded DNA-binding protein